MCEYVDECKKSQAKLVEWLELLEPDNLGAICTRVCTAIQACSSGTRSGLMKVLLVQHLRAALESRVGDWIDAVCGPAARSKSWREARREITTHGHDLDADQKRNAVAQAIFLATTSLVDLAARRKPVGSPEELERYVAGMLVGGPGRGRPVLAVCLICERTGEDPREVLQDLYGPPRDPVLPDLLPLLAGDIEAEVERLCELARCGSEKVSRVARSLLGFLHHGMCGGSPSGSVMDDRPKWSTLDEQPELLLSAWNGTVGRYAAMNVDDLCKIVLEVVKGRALEDLPDARAFPWWHATFRWVLEGRPGSTRFTTWMPDDLAESRPFQQAWSAVNMGFSRFVDPCLWAARPGRRIYRPYLGAVGSWAYCKYFDEWARREVAWGADAQEALRSALAHLRALESQLSGHRIALHVAALWRLLLATSSGRLSWPELPVSRLCDAPDADLEVVRSAWKELSTIRWEVDRELTGPPHLSSSSWTALACAEAEARGEDLRTITADTVLLRRRLLRRVWIKGPSRAESLGDGMSVPATGVDMGVFDRDPFCFVLRVLDGKPDLRVWGISQIELERAQRPNVRR